MSLYSNTPASTRAPKGYGTANRQMNFPSNTMMPYSPAMQAVPQLPTGVPTGPSYSPLPVSNVIPAPVTSEQAPQTTQSIYYTPGFLSTQIGKRMRVEFLMGTGALIDRIGTLIGVGASYILLFLTDTDDVLLCDIYSIKFVTIYH